MINGRLSSSSLTETSPTNHSNCIGSEQQLALHMGTHKPFTVHLHSGRCYTKIRGNGFRLLTQTKDIPCIIGGNREPRRATTDVHSLPILLFYFFYIEMSTCSLFSLSFFFSLLFTSFPFLFFMFTDLYGGYISLYMHFGVERLKTIINGRKAGLEIIGLCI